MKFHEVLEIVKGTNRKFRKPEWIDNNWWYIDEKGIIRSTKGFPSAESVVLLIADNITDNWELEPIKEISPEVFDTCNLWCNDLNINITLCEYSDKLEYIILIRKDSQKPVEVRVQYES